jgi:RES domain-containing protein
LIAKPALTGCLSRLPRITITGAFWRAVPIEYLQSGPPGSPAGTPPQPLWPGGGALTGGRYTPIAGCDALYLAPNGATALAEVESVIFEADGSVEPGKSHDPLLVFETRVELAAVLDLCDEDNQRALGTSMTELTRPWLRAQERYKAGTGPMPPTQALGMAACETGLILAMRYPSFRHKGKQNLVIFTDHLAALGGWVKLLDRKGTYAQRLP